MKITLWIRNSVAALALAGLVAAPVFATAQGRSKGKSDKHWNPAPPKKNGRHDNRNWNKDRRDDRRDDRRHDDWCDDDRRRDDWREDDRRYDDRWNYDRNRDWEYDRRQQSKNEWRNIAYLSGAAAILGLLKHDKTLTFAGTAGALYSLYRYEQDRKSQNRLDRLRASYFSQPYFYRDGVRYDRRLVSRDGERYYQFSRAN